MLQNTKLYFYIVILSFPYTLEAAPECEKWIAKLVSAKGRVEKQRFDQDQWRQVEKNEYFCQGDRIRTKKRSRVTLELGNDSLVTLEQSSALTFPIIDKSSFSWLFELFHGSAFFRSRSPHQLEVDTPFVNAVHEGTEFLVAVNDHQTEISVFDGRVAAENQAGRVQIDKGQIGIAEKNQVTRVQALTIHPKDAVQWALYYPPIVDYQSLGSMPTIPAIKQSLNFYHQGDVYQALSVLDNIPEQQQDQHYFGLKASLLLTVGSVDEALQEIERAQHLKATGSTASAIKAIIAVTKNHSGEALKLAKKATELNPSSAVAKIALSYAYQAAFKIPEALAATEHAVQLAPDNALAWARLAELQLSTGERSDALKSAQKAQTHNPNLDRTQTILGFAYLAQIDIDEAKTAFTKAINLNSADPLARLGLGLAKIRKGAIKEGTRDLEAAVSLDPDNAIMRSYLGKAYYELRNEGYAATELAIAKEMDPNDPTPWFYDAILKQTTNRPVEALHDMHKAIELNDNRGVYRSKLLLDEDLAARSASLGRIYNDLGFQQLGLVEGWKSVTSDPSNYSAHRLLADNYAALPRHEIARVSALLKSQLLQPINITPIQPRLAESDRLASNSLGSPSFNEYNSMFARNQFTLQGSGIIGNNDSIGDELVHAGIWNKFSYSLGQYHFKTDGIRENNDIKQDIYNAFAQYQITEDLNLQFEYRYNFLKNGDLSQQFDSTIFSKSLQENFKRQLFRVGGNYHPSPNTNVLFSVIYSGDDFNSRENEKNSPLINSNLKSDTLNIELQYIKRTDLVDIVAGGGYLKQNQIANINALEIKPLDNFPSINTITTLENELDSDSEHVNAYLYSYLTYKNLIGILGVSFDSINSHAAPDLKQFNPKVGLIWNLSDSTTLRAAMFGAVKKPLSVNPTIEPIDIAGFVQEFDDPDGTKYEQYGLGVDHKFNSHLTAGISGTYRELKVPIITPVPPTLNLPSFQTIVNSILLGKDIQINAKSNSTLSTYEKQDEYFVRFYTYWTPTDQIATSIEYQLEINDRKLVKDFSSLSKPEEVRTHRVPISFNYFLPRGPFLNLRATFVKQTLRSENIENTGNEHFWTFDATVGYRFPKRYGRFEFGVKNLSNENYQYFDRNIITGFSNTAEFLPERTFFGQVILDFNF